LETVRDYVHVDDVARAFGKSLSIQGKGENYRVFNIAAGSGHSVAEVLELIGGVTGREVRLEQSDFGKAALVLLPRVLLANGKAKEELGWEPEIGLEEGIRAMMRNADF
jgi:nucleoside-diphosphate-sugar epimerase